MANLVESLHEKCSVEEEWRKNFRMTKKTLTELCNDLRPYIEKQGTHLRECLGVKTQVAMTLYYLSHEG